jgi:predicted DNA-binding antitoxin AbrB/MazE fold protein
MPAVGRNYTAGVEMPCESAGGSEVTAVATVIEAVYRADEGVLELMEKIDVRDRSRVKVTIEALPGGETLARRRSGMVVIDEAVARQIVEHEDLLGVDR